MTQQVRKDSTQKAAFKIDLEGIDQERKEG